MGKGKVWLIGFLAFIIPSICFAWVYPVNEDSGEFEITQNFLDYLECYNGHCYNSYHLGEDIWTSNASSFREPVYAISDGIVTYSEDYRENVQDSWGYVIIIRHETPIGDICSLYGHLYQNYNMPLKGSFVREGQQIGVIGNADGKYPVHLHFEIINCDRDAIIVNSIGESYSIDLATNPGFGYTDSNSSNNPTLRYFQNPSELIDDMNEMNERSETAIEDTIDRAIYKNRLSYWYYFVDYYPNTLIIDNNWSETYELRSLYYKMYDMVNNKYHYVRIYHAYDRQRLDRRFTNFFDPINRRWDGWVYWEDT